MTGHPAYDLVSLLQDARRDVLPATDGDDLRYLDGSGLDRDAFSAAYHLLGAGEPAHVGVFRSAFPAPATARHITVDLDPAGLGPLQRDLDHPALTPVAEMLRAALPAPTPEILTRLRETCATVPKP
ncbi:MAG: hypothetical protein R3D85_04970 [Paracoccaceae bacterium]